MASRNLVVASNTAAPPPHLLSLDHERCELRPCLLNCDTVHLDTIQDHPE